MNPSARSETDQRPEFSKLLNMSLPPHPSGFFATHANLQIEIHDKDIFGSITADDSPIAFPDTSKKLLSFRDIFLPFWISRFLLIECSIRHICSIDRNDPKTQLLVEVQIKIRLRKFHPSSPQHAYAVLRLQQFALSFSIL